MKTIKFLIAALLLILSCTSVQAQFGKKLGESIKRAAQDAVTRKAEQKTDDAVSKTIDKATDPETYKGDKKKKSKKDTKDVEDAEDSVTEKTKESAQQTKKQSFESYTQYDFIPGDKILFFEDFSQDAIGDFPALWTTNSSGEVKSINAAPGKWFHMNGGTATYCYTRSIEFPANFIVEFDIIPANNDGTFEITIYSDDKREMNDEIFPGEKGVKISFADYGWEAKGYGYTDKDWMVNTSEKNPVIAEQINHVIVWIQNRRIRIYHRGEKVLDGPTTLVSGTVFRKIRFHSWDTVAKPFVSNIKITTASPDTRSKLLTEGKLVSYGICFDSNKDVVKPESYGAAKAIADVLIENPSVKIKITGHTDSDGNTASNLDLSKRRAISVKNYLAKTFGIDASRMETDGKGQDAPLADNKTVEGKAKNRRVEFEKI